VARLDLATNPDSRNLIAQLHGTERPCAFVGHGAAALLPLRGPDGAPLVAGCRLTAPKRVEDAVLGLPAGAPSLESDLTALGARYVAGPNGMPHLVQDGGWITGQNAASRMLSRGFDIGRVAGCKPRPLTASTVRQTTRLPQCPGIRWLQATSLVTQPLFIGRFLGD
jgi:hypothetical protein